MNLSIYHADLAEFYKLREAELRNHGHLFLLTPGFPTPLSPMDELLIRTKRHWTSTLLRVLKPLCHDEVTANGVDFVVPTVMRQVADLTPSQACSGLKVKSVKEFGIEIQELRWVT